MKNLPYILIGTGVALNLIDTVTGTTRNLETGKLEEKPTGGLFYGYPSGLLHGINDALPINLGLGLIILGAGLLTWRLLR